MLKSLNKPIDYMNGSPRQVLVSVSLPLLMVYAIQILSSHIHNAIYSAFVGPELFTINGYLGNVFSFYVTAASTTATAAWIKTAHFFSRPDRQESRQPFANAVHSILLVESVTVILFLVLTDPILHMVSVPGSLYQDARLYYILYILGYVPVPLTCYFLFIINGTGSMLRVFLNNVLAVVASFAATVLLLVIIPGGLFGAALCGPVLYLTQMTVYMVVLRKDGFLPTMHELIRELKPQLQDVRRMVQYGLIITVQNLFSILGMMIVSIQTNLFLPETYICVLTITLPLNVAYTALSTSVTAFVPQNYAAQKYDRVKKFLRMCTVAGLLYSLVCAAFFTLAGPWYFGLLFDDPVIIRNGAEVWFLQGVAMPCLAIAYVYRFFLDAIGQSKFSLIVGLMEFTANVLCAFWVIPQFGSIGRSLSLPLGWVFVAVSLITIYLSRRKAFYTPGLKQAKASRLRGWIAGLHRRKAV